MGVLTWCPKSGCPLPLLTHCHLLSTTGLACRASPISLQPQGQLLPAHLHHCCTAVQLHFPGNSSHPTMHWAQEPWCLFFCFLPLFALCFLGMGILTHKARSTTSPGSAVPPQTLGLQYPGLLGCSLGHRRLYRGPLSPWRMGIQNRSAKTTCPGSTVPTFRHREKPFIL